MNRKYCHVALHLRLSQQLQFAEQCASGTRRRSELYTFLNTCDSTCLVGPIMASSCTFSLVHRSLRGLKKELYCCLFVHIEWDTSCSEWKTSKFVALPPEGYNIINIRRPSWAMSDIDYSWCLPFFCALLNTSWLLRRLLYCNGTLFTNL